jgi:protein-L-isoaspartate(D-aspartate) O-methyltransferase
MMILRRFWRSLKNTAAGTEAEKAGHYARLRRKMVREQLAAGKVSDPRVLAAMDAIPRHRFVDEKLRRFAYEDGPLPIGEGQTISQPYIVALMTQLLALKGDEKVLEVGTGTGYQAAILSQLARGVHTIERHAALVEKARRILAELETTNVTVYEGDGSLGLPQEAPFDGIIVTAAGPKAPQALLEQLADGACLVLPVGDERGQHLQRWQRRGDKFDYEDIAPVSFVPLVGEQGWKMKE